MTLQEAIAEVLGKDVATIPSERIRLWVDAQAVITRAVASGDLIPRTDAEAAEAEVARLRAKLSALPAETATDTRGQYAPNLK